MWFIMITVAMSLLLQIISIAIRLMVKFCLRKLSMRDLNPAPQVTLKINLLLPICWASVAAIGLGWILQAPDLLVIKSFLLPPVVQYRSEVKYDNGE